MMLLCKFHNNLAFIKVRFLSIINPRSVISFVSFINIDIKINFQEPVTKTDQGLLLIG